jgi:hypothetical protein
MQVTPAANYSDYDLEVTLDTTSRGTTGESFSSLFGMGTSEEMARAQSFRLASGVAASPQALAFANLRCRPVRYWATPWSPPATTAAFSRCRT